MTNYSVGSGRREAAEQQSCRRKNVIHKVSGNIFKEVGARATEDECLPHTTICICDVSGQLVDLRLITR